MKHYCEHIKILQVVITQPQSPEWTDFYLQKNLHFQEVLKYLVSCLFKILSHSDKVVQKLSHGN